MQLSSIYKFIDSKYLPIIGYLSISPIEEIKESLISIQKKAGIMRDYFGFEFEENNTLTFYDFSSNEEKKINVSVQEFIEILNPMLDEYLDKFSNEKSYIETIIKNIYF